MVPLEDRVNWNKHVAKTIQPFDFYSQHHAGLTRGQLRKQDPSLYQRLRRDGSLGKVPVSNADFGDDPVAYYQQHRAGLTRWELAKQDPGLYQRLWRDGLLGSVPTSKTDFGNDPVAYYHQHRAGLTRWELAKQDPGLYQRLRRDGSLGGVPTADMGEVRKQFSKFGVDPVAYYQQHHAGLTRGELAKQNPGLYKRLWRDGLLESVPKKVK